MNQELENETADAIEISEVDETQIETQLPSPYFSAVIAMACTFILLYSY